MHNRLNTTHFVTGTLLFITAHRFRPIETAVYQSILRQLHQTIIYACYIVYAATGKISSAFINLLTTLFLISKITAGKPYLHALDKTITKINDPYVYYKNGKQ